MALVPVLAPAQSINYYPASSFLGGTITAPLLISHGVNPGVPQFKLEAGDSYGDFVMQVAEFANVGDTRENRVYRLGYNLAGGGARLVAGDPAFGIEFESHYAPDANRYTEFHLAYYKADATAIRTHTWIADKTTDNLILSTTANKYVLYSAATLQPSFIFTDMTALDVQSGSLVRKSTNNAGWLQQLNAAGNSFVNILYLDSRDTVMLGENHSNIAGVEAGRELSYAPYAYTVADSGGAGAATSTLTPTHSFVNLTCSDADGCDITMGETGIRSGTVVTIVNTSANTANFADTGGVSELAGAFAMGQYDSLSLLYAADRWVETGRSNN
jgi:hypothetical protein